MSPDSRNNPDNNGGITYQTAGVDTEAGDLAVELMRSAVSATHTTDVIGGFGGFAGLWDASALTGYRKPYLATSTDGVGTKVAIAQALDIHDTIGFDLVGMVVDDIVVVGAKPLFMTDYIACGKVVPDRIANIVRGVAEACKLAGTALVGGETAEHPGLLGEDEYDIAGAVTGVVEADEMLGPDRVQDGDILIALGSSGLHSNGYSLVRSVIAHAGWELERHVPEFGRTLGEELLEPTKVYASDCLDLAAGGDVHAYTHVTGGGLAANLARVIPSGLTAIIRRDSWVMPPVFSVIQQLGAVPWSDLEATLNLGVGMVAIVPGEAAARVQQRARERGMAAWELGVITSERPQGPIIEGTKGVDAGGVQLINEYRLS